MKTLLMLDSGAFTVWSQGKTIDLNEYIKFCKEHPGISYYVNLDVIPGKPGDVRSKTKDAVEASCEQGWKNYQEMIRHLPIEKVIPVFHRGENLKWLEKYLNFGTPYIGIGLSGALGSVTQEKRAWLNDMRKFLFDSAGNPIVKTHGFAITSFAMMKFMPWHSVDSSSWVKQAAFGTVYVPMLKNGEFRYDVPPFLLSCSPKSPSKNERQKHINTLSPTVVKQVQRYLEYIKMRPGTYEVEPVSSNYKLQDEELWWVKKKSVMKITERGLMTCHQRRFWANMKFIHKANEVLPVDHIYFAGAAGSLLDQIEYRTKRRLFSYHVIATSKKAAGVLRKHIELMENPAAAI